MFPKTYILQQFCTYLMNSQDNLPQKLTYLTLQTDSKT